MSCIMIPNHMITHDQGIALGVKDNPVSCRSATPVGTPRDDNEHKVLIHPYRFASTEGRDIQKDIGGMEKVEGVIVADGLHLRSP